MKINIQRRVHGIHKIFRNRRLEYYWTIGPLLFLIGISVSPMLYIYLHEATVVGLMKRVIRNQWYWSYRVLVKENGGVWDSLYVNGSLTRCDSWNSNLESNLRWAVSSNDVIHNWRVAGSSEDTLGVKMDAYPGWCNIVQATPMYHRGLYTRYCSELCGTHHSYIPIML